MHDNSDCTAKKCIVTIIVSYPCVAAVRSTATCEALQSLSDHAFLVRCTRNQQCSELQCDVLGLGITTAALTLLPCRQPAGIRLILYSSPNSVVLSQTIDRTTVIQVTDGTSLVATLDQLTNSIGLEVIIVKINNLVMERGDLLIWCSFYAMVVVVQHSVFLR